jgi:hypothetical protein
VISNGTAAPVVHSTLQSPHSPLLISSGDSLIHRPPAHPESAASLLPRIRCHRLPCAPVCLCRPPRTLPFSPPEATTKASLFGLATLHELRRRIISARRRALSPLGTGMGAQEADASGAGTEWPAPCAYALVLGFSCAGCGGRRRYGLYHCGSGRSRQRRFLS